MERYAAIDVALGGSSACVVDAEDDRRHGRCLAAFSASAVLLATSAAVLAEMLHLVGCGHHRGARVWTSVRSGGVAVAPIDDGDLAALPTLMTRDANRPMNVADATLVHLAEPEALSTAPTIDHADFDAYRIAGRGGSEWCSGGERRGYGRRSRPRSSLVRQVAGAASRRWSAPDRAKSFGGGVLPGMPRGLVTLGPARQAMAKTEERW